MKLRHGFTLLELLVSISIMGIMAAIVGPSITHARRGQELQQAAELIKQKIVEAQGLAMSPPKDNAGNEYYGVQVTQSNPVKLKLARKKIPADTLITKVDDSYGNLSTLDNISLVSPSVPPVVSIWFKIGNVPVVSAENINKNADGSYVFVLKSDPNTRNVTVNSITGAANAE